MPRKTASHRLNLQELREFGEVQSVPCSSISELCDLVARAEELSCQPMLVPIKLKRMACLTELAYPNQVSRRLACQPKLARRSGERRLAVAGIGTLGHF